MNTAGYIECNQNKFVLITSIYNELGYWFILIRKNNHKHGLINPIVFDLWADKKFTKVEYKL